jgi:RNA polymerase primary sigma factor
MRMIDAVSKVVRTSRRILHKIGREPTPEELAEKLGMPLERVRKVLKIAKEPLSLETPIGRRGKICTWDIFPRQARLKRLVWA